MQTFSHFSAELRDLGQLLMSLFSRKKCKLRHKKHILSKPVTVLFKIEDKTYGLPAHHFDHEVQKPTTPVWLVQSC